MRQKNDGKGRQGGGRKPGVPNKVTKEMRENIRDFVRDNYEGFCDAWNDIEDPKEKCQIYTQLVKFVVPTLSSVEFDPKNVAKSASATLVAMREELVKPLPDGAEGAKEKEKEKED